MLDLLDSLWTPLRALIVAACGIWLASAWLHGRFGSGPRAALSVMAIVLAVAVLGYVAEYVGSMQLPQAPVLAVILMEWWTLAPLAIAAGASALVIVFAVDWSLPSTAPEADKQLAAQTTTAVATFLVAAFVSWSADQNESPASSRIQKAFKRK